MILYDVIMTLKQIEDMRRIKAQMDAERTVLRGERKVTGLEYS